MLDAPVRMVDYRRALGQRHIHGNQGHRPIKTASQVPAPLSCSVSGALLILPRTVTRLLPGCNPIVTFLWYNGIEIRPRGWPRLRRESFSFESIPFYGIDRTGRFPSLTRWTLGPRAGEWPCRAGLTHIEPTAHVETFGPGGRRFPYNYHGHTQALIYALPPCFLLTERKR
jgi:hypothetical protein